MSRTLILLLLIAALATACKPAAPGPDFDIQGRIVDIVPGDGQYKDFLGTIRIEGEPVDIHVLRQGAGQRHALHAHLEENRGWLCVGHVG